MLGVGRSTPVKIHACSETVMLVLLTGRFEDVDVEDDDDYEDVSRSIKPILAIHKVIQAAPGIQGA